MSTPRGNAWDDLIKAIVLLRKHATNEVSPFHCEHDTLYVMANPHLFSLEERKLLDEIGFHSGLDSDEAEDFDELDEDTATFYSFRFGSA